MQVALTPYKYKNTVYLKMLNSRLSEADKILNQDYFTDKIAVEKLIRDIDDTYERCSNKNYFDSSQYVQMQIRIIAVKEGFKKRYGIQKNYTNGSSGQNKEDIENTTDSNTDTQSFGQSSSGTENNSETENNNSLNGGEQNQKGKQNQYGK